jgi:hypothetical protein
VTRVIGFTGTRGNLTAYQISFIVDVLRYQQPEEVHHGDCVGADSLFHALCEASEYVKRIVIHPPTDDKHRAFCKGAKVQLLDPLSYIARNHAIVDAAEVMLAAPSTDNEELRSGTWATVRYSLKKKRKTMLLQPNGTASWLDRMSEVP